MDTEDLSQFVKPIAPSLLKRVSTDNNTLMTPTTRFEQNQDLGQLDITSHIVPTPNQVRLSKGNLDISQGLDFTSLPLSNKALEAIEHRAVTLGLAGQGEQKVYGDIDPDALDSKLRVSGGYQLSITDRGIIITAFDETGMYYAVQSIFSLVDVKKPTVLPLVDVVDAPRYQYRGVMVDVARNFHSKSAIFQTLDQMAAYKLNKLHLHLTDDEGWRLEIPGLPELTDIGAKRCFDKSETSCLLPQLGSGLLAITLVRVSSADKITSISCNMPQRVISKSFQKSTCQLTPERRLCLWKHATVSTLSSVRWRRPMSFDCSIPKIHLMSRRFSSTTVKAF